MSHLCIQSGHPDLLFFSSLIAFNNELLSSCRFNSLNLTLNTFCSYLSIKCKTSSSGVKKGSEGLFTLSTYCLKVSDGKLLLEIPAQDFYIFQYKLAFSSLASQSLTVCRLLFSGTM